MTPDSLKARIIWFEELDSTNSELRRHISEYDNMSIVATMRQSKGRGQGDHSWYSSPCTNLTFSVLYRYDGTLEVKDCLLITEVTTLAIRDFLLTEGIEARIKWPNDIWVGDRKICGILIENILDGSLVRESIVGIGLDLNETGWPEDLPNPVSLKELTGKDYDLKSSLEKLAEAICRRFGQMASDDGRIQLQEEFGKYMFRLHEEQR